MMQEIKGSICKVRVKRIVKKYNLIVLFVIFFCSVSSADGIKPPSVLIYKGMCPFGCCSNAKKKVDKATIARILPDKESEIVSTLKVGSIVECITGEEHFKPSRFVVKKSFGKYKPNDIIWAYKYLEEGFFRVWFNGQMYEEDLGFDPYDESSGKRCEKSDLCLGVLDEELVSTIWIKIRSPEGWEGWTCEPQNLSDIQ